MPDAEAIVELRSLQERAYGRAGGLSDEDAARLRELERLPTIERGSATTEEPQVVERGSPTTEESQVVERGSEATETKRGFLHRVQGPADSSPPGRSTTEARSTPQLRGGLRARGKAFAALVVAILVGVLVGWALFSPRAPQAVPLSAEQQSWQNEILVSAVYDSGSLRPIAEEDGTIVWFATRDGGDIVCAIISDGETTAPACRERDVATMRGLQTSLRREIDGGEGLVEAQILFDAEGDPAALTSHSLIGGGTGGAYATEEEQRAAEMLADSGYDPSSLNVVGHDGDVPLWVGVERSSGRWCLIYGGPSSPILPGCEEAAALFDEGIPLMLARSDPETGASTAFEYWFGPGPPYLQITRNVDGSAP